MFKHVPAPQCSECGGDGTYRRYADGELRLECSRCNHYAILERPRPSANVTYHYTIDASQRRSF